jgi:hypothetical protein
MAQASAASAQAAALEQQAALRKRQAGLEREAGAFEASRIRRQGQKLAGSQVAAAASSGIAPTSASTLAAIEESGEQVGLDADLALFGANRRAENEELSAEFARQNAKSVRGSAGLSFLPPVVGAFAKHGTAIKGAFS